jgi:ubiquinone/menaquinone biosynthesis C-methylase UbiE
MSAQRVDYDRLSSRYNRRYQAYSLSEIGEALAEIASGRILEVGCGTGRWLENVFHSAALIVGADASFGMLKQTRTGAALVNADANALPFRADSFDFIFCVNALHHFDDKHGFIRDAVNCLRQRGTLAIVGIDPRTIRERYIYQYFDTTLTTDLARYPSFGEIVDAMSAAGLDDVQHRIVHTWKQRLQGRDVLNDPFLARDSNSALALLSEEEYQLGLERVRAAAERNAVFESVLPFGMTTGRRVAT